MIQGQVTDVLKNFRWDLEMDGLPFGYAQKCNIPEQSFNEVTHGGDEKDVKTAGRRAVGDITIEKLMPGNDPDNFATDWFQAQVDTPPSEHCRDFYIIHYGFNRQTVIGRWLVLGAWVKSIKYADNEKGSDDNMVETMTLACLDVIKEI